MKKPVEHLERVDPASLWASESGDFIPWLAMRENLCRLGDALGLDLEPVAREVMVGRFRADLVCRDPRQRRQGGDRGPARAFRPRPSRPAPDLWRGPPRQHRGLARHCFPRRAPRRPRPAQRVGRLGDALLRRGVADLEHRRLPGRAAVHGDCRAPRPVRPLRRGRQGAPSGGGRGAGGSGRHPAQGPPTEQRPLDAAIGEVRRHQPQSSGADRDRQAPGFARDAGGHREGAGHAAGARSPDPKASAVPSIAKAGDERRTEA